MVSRFVHNANIKRFEALLLAETDVQRRAVLMELLANERADDDDSFAGPDPEAAQD